MAEPKLEQTRIIEELIEGLKSVWNEDIQGSIHALASFGEPAIMPLLRALEHGSPRMYCHAATVLAEIPSEESVPSLLWMLKEKPMGLASQKAILETFVQVLQPSDENGLLLDYLRSLSRHEDAGIRRSVAKGLGRLQSKSALTTLHFFQQDPSASVRQEAEKAISSIRSRYPSLAPICLSTQTIAAAIRLHARELPEPPFTPTPPSSQPTLPTSNSWKGVVTELSPRLCEAGEQTLEELAPLLRSFPLPEASESLRAIILAETASEERRLAALHSLQQIHPKDPSLFPLFRDLLTQSPSAKLRLASLRSVLQIQPRPSEFPFLLFRLLRDSSPEIQEEASLALPSCLSSQRKDLLLRYLLEALRAGPHPQVRLALFRSLDLLLDGAPEDSLLAQDLIEGLSSASEAEALVLLRILSRLRLFPSPTLSQTLLALLQRTENTDISALSLHLLRQLLSSKHTQAVSQIHQFTDEPTSSSSLVTRELRQILAALPDVPIDSGGFPTFPVPTTPSHGTSAFSPPASPFYEEDL